MASSKINFTLTADAAPQPGSADWLDSAKPTELVAERRVSAFDLVASQPWAILPAMLETIAAIARRENESVESLEARLGRPLQNSRSVTVRDGVALIPVTGPIMRYGNMFSQISGATSLDALATDFARAVDDPAVKSIVLNMDSPGGQANGIAEFAAMVRSADKHVVAYVDGSAASAAYWIASAADEIVVSKTAEVGSIGAVVTLNASKRAGEIEIVSSQSPNKRPDVATDAGRAQIQARIDRFAQVFIDDVAAYRGVSSEHVLANYGQGDMRMGADAVSLGMADRVSTLEAVLAGLSGSTPSQGAKIMANQAAAAGEPVAVQPEITREFLATSHPDLFASILAEGAQAELARVLSVQSQSLPGHESLIAQLMADGKTSGPEAAVQILAAERKLSADRRSNLAADALAPLPFAAATSAAEDAAVNAPEADDASLPLEARCQAKWDKSADLQKEFSSFESYVAFARATESGRARVLSK